MATVLEVAKSTIPKRAIDIHLHLGRGFGWFLGTQTDYQRTTLEQKDPGAFTAEDAIAIHDELNTRKAVVFAPSDPPYYNENGYVIDLMKSGKYKDRFVALARVNQFDPKTSLEIMSMCEGVEGFMGIKLHNAVSPGKMYGPRGKPIFDRMVEMGWTVATVHPCVHPCSAMDIELVAERYPSIQFIIQHLGEALLMHPEGVADYVQVALRHDNVYFDTSEATPASLPLLLLNGVPADRILFGSDTPYCNYLVTLPVWKYVLDVYGVSEVDQDKIFYTNAAKLFGFD